MGGERFVINTRIIGLVCRESPKLKMFMISVLWSDETEVIIYRSFQDFKRFHRQLKKRFPKLNPLKKNDRVIPKFMGMARKSSLQQRGSKRCVQRIKFLESYCVELFQCGQPVTQSSEVTQFFISKDHDLQCDFTKNSVMILMSNDLPDASGEEVGCPNNQHASGISQPFVTQTYRCVAAYETKDTKNRPFKAGLDERLDVLIKDPAGWWLVENEEKRLAWFPAPFLDSWEGEDDVDTGFHLGGALYCAVRSYSTKKDDEVSVSIGSVVEVLKKSDNGWWLIRFNGKAGYIPSMYLQPYNNPCSGLFSLQRKLHNSTLNLATSGRSHPGRITEEESSLQDSENNLRVEPNVVGHFQKAKSLDVLFEPWSQNALPVQTENDGTTSDSCFRSMTSTSTDSSFSISSSSSELSPSLREATQLQRHSGQPAPPHQSDVSECSSPDVSLYDRCGSRSSSESSGCFSSKSSDTASIAPRVPPRPKREEILTRCTTMTRKAALVTKTRLQVQSPESILSR